MLDFRCTFDMGRKRFKRLDHPDILLVCCVVFATKLLYPFDGIQRPPVSYRDPSSLQIDWNQWRELMRDPESEGLERRVMRQLKPDDAWTLNDKKIDDYLDWYEETQVKTGDEPQELTELFPLTDGRVQKPKPELTEEEIDDRLKTAQSYNKSVPPAKGGWVRRTGDDHAVYRTPEDLPDVAKAFYSKAADLSGLSVGILVKAVYALEVKVRRWSTQKAKPEANQSVGSE
jgi:RNA polymerase I-specific transcription initiation factor RRN7